MGLAIINQLANYTLHRIAQNVIPLDATKRVPLTSVSQFDYKSTPELSTNGNLIYRLLSLNIGTATQPYVYSLLGDPTGASVDPISGVVTITSEFTGSLVTIVLSAVYDAEYYKAPSNSALLFKVTTLIDNILAPNADSTSTYNNLTITEFSYSSALFTENGGLSVLPTLHYSYDKLVNDEIVQITDAEDTEGVVTYAMHQISDNGASVNSTNGRVTATQNLSLESRIFIVEAKVIVDGVPQTEVTKIVLQAATNAPVTYTYSIENVSLSYNPSTVTATGNSNGITPTLSYTLYKNGSDNSRVESQESVAILYSVNGTLPTNVTLDSATGKVTFEENASDNPVPVEVIVTLSKDSASETANFTVTLSPRAITNVTFKSYNDQTTTSITVAKDTTINTSELTFNLIYDVGPNGILNGSDEGVTLGTEHTTSLTFSNTGTVLMVAHYGSFDINISVTVMAIDKAFIVSIPEEPYPTTNLTPTNNGTKISVPLHVNVQKPTGEVEEMTFDMYLTISDKEDYTVDVTFRDAFFDYNIPEEYNEVSSTGTLVYDLTKDNYVYDKTRITNISVNCTSNSAANMSHVCEYPSTDPESIDMSNVYADYFTNSNNFTSTTLTASETGCHFSDTYYNKDTTNSTDPNIKIHYNFIGKVVLSSSGSYYKLTKPTESEFADFYFSIQNSNYFVIISTNENNLTTVTNSNKSTAGYTPNGLDIKVIESGTTPRYVHHRTNKSNTFIVGLNNFTSVVKLLTPVTNTQSD